MYTRGGDKGETGLFGGRRVPKDSARVIAYGTIDELNSSIGMAVAVCADEEISNSLKKIQRLLFVAGADLASDIDSSGSRVPRIAASDVKWLESEVDSMQERLPKLTKFILPGGSELSARLHLARAVCRRAETEAVTAGRDERINPELVPFLNRLSTHLFNVARLANMKLGRADETWEH